MRKFIILIITLVSVLCSMSFTVKTSSTDEPNPYVTPVNMGDFRSITVYKITIVGQNGAASKQAVSAEFDKDRMELRVAEKRNGKSITMTYSVVRNPYKGYNDDPRGSYDYRADCYYFN